MLANRQQKLNKHLKELKQLADVNNALVLVTNQVHSSQMQCGETQQADWRTRISTRQYIQALSEKGKGVEELLD